MATATKEDSGTSPLTASGTIATGDRSPVPASAVGACCRTSAAMLILADQHGHGKDKLLEFQILNLKQAALLRRAADIADEMLVALKFAATIIGHPDDDGSKLIAEVISKAEVR